MQSHPLCRAPSGDLELPGPAGRRLRGWTVGALVGCALRVVPAQAQVPPVPAGHPRVYVRAADLPGVQARLALSRFASTWAAVQASDDAVCRAFVYLVQGDATAGQSAVSAALDELVACTDARTFDTCMHRGAVVYDWCYDLLSPVDRAAFIAEFERVADSHSPYYPAELGHGAVVGHTTEGWLLTGQLPAGIAIYDETHTMYEAAAAVFFEEFVPVRDYLYPAHMHHQGDSYTGTRFQHDQAASWLFRRLGAGDVLTTEQRFVPYQLLYNLRPDWQQLRSGDTYDDSGRSNSKRRLFALTGAYYQDPFLLEMAEQSHFGTPSPLDRVLRLLLEPTDATRRPIAELPRAKFFAPPMGEMIVRTGWSLGVESADAVLRLRVGGTFFGNHQRKDFGTFQIYYRGPLAISSGVYEGDSSEYGSEHWRHYYHQTIAHNGLLVFDPAEQISFQSTSVANDGGQWWPNNGADHPRDLDTLLTRGYEVARVTAWQLGPDAMAPEYSYLAGDITGAYNPAKVARVTRSMVALVTGDATYPAALVVFDRVRATAAALAKTWLLHTIQEPAIDDRRISAVRDGPTYNSTGTYGGKLVVESLLPEAATVAKVGGAGREFWIESTQTSYTTSKAGAAEPGAWRVEVRPVEATVDDLFLHVLTVMDATTAAGPAVARLRGALHEGATVLDRAVLFGREPGPHASADFTLTGDAPREILVCDLQPGPWQVRRDGLLASSGVVSAEGGCLAFTGEAGVYQLEPGGPALDGGIAEDGALAADAGQVTDISSALPDPGAGPDRDGLPDAIAAADVASGLDHDGLADSGVHADAVAGDTLAGDARSGDTTAGADRSGGVDVLAGHDHLAPDVSAAPVSADGATVAVAGVGQGCSCASSRTTAPSAFLGWWLLLGRRRRLRRGASWCCALALLLALVACPASPVATEAMRFACAAPSDCLPRHACVDGVCVPAAELDAGAREGVIADRPAVEGGIGDAPAPDRTSPDRPAPDGAAVDAVGLDSSARDQAAPDDAAAADQPPADTQAGPDVAPTDAVVVDVATVDGTIVDTAAPDTAAPDTAAPDLATPDLAAPDTTAPDLAAPDTAAPDTAPVDAGPVVVETVVAAATVFPDANTTHTVTLGTAVDPDRSILVFSVTTTSVTPSDGNVAGQLINNGTQVRFRRISAGTTNVQIRYSVVELVDARVQRGTAVMNSGVLGIGPVIAAVDRGRSFALHSWMIVGGNYNSNDFYRIDLQDDTHVRVRRGDSEDQATVEWQVVELPAAASVVSLDFALSTSELAKDVALSPAVVLGQSLALVSYEVSTFTSNDVKSNALRGRLHDAATLRLSRGDNNVAIAGTAFVVQWPALDVRHGVVAFAAGDAEQRASLAPAVDPARSVVFAPSIQRQGETALSEGTDHIGAVWMTCELGGDGSEVIVQRGNSDGASTFSWTVVQFP